MLDSNRNRKVHNTKFLYSSINVIYSKTEELEDKKKEAAPNHRNRYLCLTNQRQTLDSFTKVVLF